MLVVSNKKRPTIPAKYRNPANPEDTWSGRGRKPLWVVALLESGGSLDSCFI
ncbi:H-NS histone family protein [Candidatus Thiothrix anitrata]